MKKNFAVSFAMVLAMAALAEGQGQAPVKLATIFVQNAILGTKEGGKAQQELQTRFAARKQELEKMQADIQALQARNRAGGPAMNEEARSRLMREIDAKTKTLNRDSQDFNDEVQQEQGKLINELGGRMMEVIVKYATQNGIAAVIDVSSPQTPVLWADPSIDITNQMIKLYDEAHPVAEPAKPAAPPAIPPRKQ